MASVIGRNFSISPQADGLVYTQDEGLISGAPAWWTDDATFPEATWTRVAGGAGFGAAWQNGARLSDAGAPSAGITDPWTSGVLDPVRKELILAACGGHEDYSGNEVYILKVGEETPGWELAVEKSLVISTGGDKDDPTGAYADGTPRSCHHWNIPEFADGKIWFPMTSGMFSFAGDTSVVWSLDRGGLDDASFPIPAASAGWTSYGQPWLYSGNVGQNGHSAAWDPVGRRMWLCLAQGTLNGGVCLCSYDIDDPAGTYTLHTGMSQMSVGSTGSWCVVIPDSTPRVLLYGNRREARIHIFDISSNNPAGWTLANISGGLTPTRNASAHYYNGALYEYHHSFGASIRKIAVPADPINGTYAYSTFTPASGATPPGFVNPNFQGPLKKFNLVPDMGDGRPALVSVHNINETSYVFKLPAGGI